MSRFFRRCMRYGAAILFAVALVKLVVGLIPLIYLFASETGRMATNYSYSPEYPGSTRIVMLIEMLIAALSSAAIPFFGALVIDRLDKFLERRNEEAAE